MSLMYEQFCRKFLQIEKKTACEFYLCFVGIPSEPRDVEVSPVPGFESSRQLIKWNHPEDLGNMRQSEITYNVSWCPVINSSTVNCEPSTETVNITSFTVRNLMPNVTYQYSIQAINLRNEASNATTAELPTNETDCELKFFF